MPCTIYLDTSVLCALADPPARSADARTCQSLSRRWFRSLTHTAQLCASEFALQRLRAGPSHLTSARLTVADSLSVLPFKKNIRRKSKLFIGGGGLRAKFDDMGCEIACASTFGVRLFVTWQWSQLEPQRLAALHIMLEQTGLSRIDFITPLQLLEADYETLLPATGHRLP